LWSAAADALYTVLLVLAARREESTQRLLEAQRVYPALREAVQSILDDW
jgi:hypothetical protein